MTDEQSGGTQSRIARLLARVNAGDEGARGELMEESYELFERIARNWLNKPDFVHLRKRGVETGDVLHGAFEKRIFNRNKFGKDLLGRKGFSEPKDFIRAVVNNIIGHLKDLRANRIGASPRRAKQGTNAPTKGGRQVVDKAPDPAFARAEESVAAIEILEKLDDMDRQIFVFRSKSGFGMSREEVAKELGISTKTVTRRMRKVTEQLAAALKEA